MTRHNLSFRPVKTDDNDFLFEVYAGTRREEFAAANWANDEVETFLKSQFKIQHDYYQKFYANTQFQIILLNKEKIGRLYIDRREDEIRIVDIAILPNYRNLGIGSKILKTILNEASEKKIHVRIHVEKNNPAMNLYKRLGFCDIEDKGVYLLLERAPGPRHGI